MIYTEEDCVAFSESMAHWKAFPDTVEAIKELRKYTKCVMLTNTDKDIAPATLSNAGIEVDLDRYGALPAAADSPITAASCFPKSFWA
ncbi:MAG: hypothetical protein V8R75_03480 [Oscillospiraceae bacterium]